MAPEEALILESGEDIDLVADALRADSDRLLEQVKVREEVALSLSSATAREALANAARTARENPTLRLRFRFTTTATIARERGLRGTQWPAGITLWEELRTRARSTGDSRAFETLRGLLGNRRPSGISPVNWAELITLRDDPGGFAKLVDQFEWAMASLPPDQLPQHVVAALVSAGVFANSR